MERAERRLLEPEAWEAPASLDFDECALALGDDRPLDDTEWGGDQ